MPDENRTCAKCGSATTYIYKHKYGNYSMWYKSKDGNGWLCNSCHKKYVSNPTTKAKWNPRHLKFKDKIICVSENPRVGVCNRCRAVVGVDCKQTHIHHEDYDVSNPLANTIELCVACHNKTKSNLGRRKPSNQ